LGLARAGPIWYGNACAGVHREHFRRNLRRDPEPRSDTTGAAEPRDSYPIGTDYRQVAGERPRTALPVGFGCAGRLAAAETRHGFGTRDAVHVRPSLAPKTAAALASFCVEWSPRHSATSVRIERGECARQLVWRSKPGAHRIDRRLAVR